jgi:vacuolar-type H+-ATPase subunit H
MYMLPFRRRARLRTGTVACTSRAADEHPATGSSTSIALCRDVQAAPATKPVFSIAVANLVMAAPAQAAGALFDFDLTMPIMTAQFLLLMVFLDKTWFTPVGKVLEDRDESIRNKLQSVQGDSKEIAEMQERAEKELREARAAATAEVNEAKKTTQAEQDEKLAKLKEVRADAAHTPGGAVAGSVQKEACNVSQAFACSSQRQHETNASTIALPRRTRCATKHVADSGACVAAEGGQGAHASDQGTRRGAREGGEERQRAGRGALRGDRQPGAARHAGAEAEGGRELASQLPDDGPVPSALALDERPAHRTARSVGFQSGTGLGWGCGCRFGSAKARARTAGQRAAHAAGPEARWGQARSRARVLTMVTGLAAARRRVRAVAYL